MPTAPVQELKRHLADWLALVEAGETITVTRRNRPVAVLSPLTRPGRHVGKDFGAGRLEALPFSVAPGTVARVIAEDRGDDR